MPRYNYGGQALIEGVLMRGRDAIAVALRHPDGQIVWATERLDSGFHGSRTSRLPFVRGLVVLYETLIVGTRWLVRSASVAASGEGIEIGRGAIALMLGITLTIGIGVFFLVPLLFASATVGNVQNGLVQHLVEGLIRVGLFMAGSRIVLIPVIASIGYEILRAGARYRRNPIVHAILLPGLWVQMITTKRPTDEMIRVAIVSMEEALVADGEPIPTGSEPINR